MDNQELKKDLIIQNTKYPFIYHISFILIITLVPLIYIFSIFKYQFYYKCDAIVADNYLLINKIFTTNNKFIYNNVMYSYKVISNKEDSQSAYILPNYKLNIKNNKKITIKIVGNKQTIIEYIFNYLGKESDNT